MEVALNAEAQDLIDQNIGTGPYATPEEVVHAALAAFTHNHSGDFATGEWDQFLAEGEASIQTNGTLDGDDALAARRQRRLV